MKTKKILSQTLNYFGKNRTLINGELLKFSLEDKFYSPKWNKIVEKCTKQPFKLYHGVNEILLEYLQKKKYHEINWKEIGDISWTIEVVLNKGIKKSYDWDTKLATKCGGTARILRFLVSDVLPFYTSSHYVMSYCEQTKEFELGPITKFSKREKKIIKSIQSELEKEKYKEISQEQANIRHKDLWTDCITSNARIFDCLFCDLLDYQNEFVRFPLARGLPFSWKKYFSPDYNLLRVQQSHSIMDRGQYFEVTADNNGKIQEIMIYGKKKNTVINVSERIFSMVKR